MAINGSGMAGEAGHAPLEAKAVAAVYEELVRQAEENPSILQVRRDGDRAVVEGEVDLDALAMVVIGAMAGGP